MKYFVQNGGVYAKNTQIRMSISEASSPQATFIFRGKIEGKKQTVSPYLTAMKSEEGKKGKKKAISVMLVHKNNVLMSIEKKKHWGNTE